MSDVTEQWATALYVEKYEPSVLTGSCIVGVWEATSKEEAIGFAVQSAKEKFPDRAVSATAAMRIDRPAPAVDVEAVREECESHRMEEDCSINCLMANETKTGMCPFRRNTIPCDWDTKAIAAALAGQEKMVLAQQTHNTGSLQCSVCSSHNVNVIHVCEKCGSEIDVSNWRDRAQQVGA